MNTRQSPDFDVLLSQMSTTVTTRPTSTSSQDHNDRFDPNLKRKSSIIRTRSAPALPRSQQRSPTDSACSSDSDLDSTPKTTVRGRRIDKELEHKLHEAVSSIRVTRSQSPEFERRTSDDSVIGVPSVVLTNVPRSVTTTLVPESGLGHARSASHQGLPILSLHTPFSTDSSSAVESDAEDSSLPSRPHRMVRKKSGELVRSSLKSGGRRPASMPSTPVFTKNVKFDRKLEHIRHFLHSEKPAAVSATTSPSQEYFGNDDFPFRSSPRKSEDDYELTIELPNFIPEAQQTDNEGAIIKVETVYLSTDKRSLIGRVAVRNLAFQKYVCVRYTLDYWRTTSESAAEYTEDVRKRQRDDPFDRFLFHIKIDDFSGVTDKTMFFCVRYNTAGQDYWDSNGGQNFRVEFHNRSVANRRASDPPLMQPIRRTSADDIEVRLDSQNTSHALKSPRSLIFENIYDDHPSAVQDDDDHGESVKTKSPSKRVGANDSFSNRYDFGASLTAAIAAANHMLQGSGEEIKLKNKGNIEHVEHVGATPYNPYFAVKPEHLEAESKDTVEPKQISSKSSTPASSGDVSPVPGISSRPSDSTDQGRAYQTLLDNYCFVSLTRRIHSILSLT